MLRRVRPRRGVSLTEVLVAMFIMAVGMIAIFTLFPLGAMQVGHALQNDRASQTAQQADGYIRDLWRNHVALELAAGREPTEPFYWAMNDPNEWVAPPVSPPAPSGVYMLRTPRVRAAGGANGHSFLPSAFQLPAGNNAPSTTANAPISPSMLSMDAVTNPPATTGPAAAGDPNFGVTYSNATFGAYPVRQPTYPVFLDPLGAAYRTGGDQVWVSRTATASLATRVLLPRRQLNAVFTSAAVSQQQFALQVAGMTDDVIFDPTGTPPSAAGLMTRQGRYSWAAVIQRPDASRKDVADLTILAFDGRSRLPAISAPAGTTPQPYNDELVVAPFGTQSRFDRQVTVDVPARGSDDPVLVRRGGWVMDGTIDTNLNGRKNAFFYRITGVTEGATAGGLQRLTLDLETPLQQDLTATSQLYFFAGLIEVFPRPQLRPDFNY